MNTKNNANNANTANTYTFQNLILEAFDKLNTRFLLSETEKPIFELIEKLVERKNRHKLFFLDLDYNRSPEELIDYFGSEFEYYSDKHEIHNGTNDDIIPPLYMNLNNPLWDKLNVRPNLLTAKITMNMVDDNNFNHFVKQYKPILEKKYKHELDKAITFDLDSNGVLDYQKANDLDKVTYSTIVQIINMYDIIKIDNNKSLLSLQITKRDTDLSKQFSKLLDYLELPQHINTFIYNRRQLFYSNYIANGCSFNENETFVLTKNNDELGSVCHNLSYESLLEYVEITNFDVNTVCHILSNNLKHADKLHRFLNDCGNKIKNLKPMYKLINAIDEYEFNKFVDKTNFDDYYVYQLARKKFGKENDNWIDYSFEMPIHVYNHVVLSNNKIIQSIYKDYVSRRFEIVDEILANNRMLRYNSNLDLEENITKVWLLIEMTTDSIIKRVLVEEGLLYNVNHNDYIVKMYNAMEQLEVINDFISFNSSLKDEFYGYKLLSSSI